ncbi:Uncharacterised protein [Klebsiella pneumoniae]|nr:Uncharacterised protein [Klebsiella pneumoniae]
MLRIIVEFLTKVGLRIEVKLVKLLQQEQGDTFAIRLPLFLI